VFIYKPIQLHIHYYQVNKDYGIKLYLCLINYAPCMMMHGWVEVQCQAFLTWTTH